MSEFNDFNSLFDKYKSWGNLKKQMQDLLCTSLQNKITYFYTRYHKQRGSFGRASINCDKQELISFSWDIGLDIQWADEYKTILSEKDSQKFGNIREMQRQIHETLMREKWMPNGTLYHMDFLHAVLKYLQTDVISALHSDNYLLRIFAYMDRRIGKRTLVKIKDEVEILPDWVKKFYKLRCEAEGLPCSTPH